MKNLRVFISNEGWGQVAIRIGAHNPDGSLVAVEPLQFKLFSKEQLERGDLPGPGSMVVLMEQDAETLMQSFMDALWDRGLRPKDIGTAGHLSATQKHLEDMRTIAFAKLDVTK